MDMKHKVVSKSFDIVYKNYFLFELNIFYKLVVSQQNSILIKP